MSKSVLVVEDEPDLREIMQTLLEAFGHRVVTASNGQEALDILTSSELPGLIFLDISMPVMSGIEFLTIVQSGQHPDLEKIPVIVISAVIDYSDLQSFNCKALLTKPSEIEPIMKYAQQFTQ